MTREDFIDKTLDMIKKCECNSYSDNEIGFKLKIEKNNIKSITVTTQVLLIFQQLFGSNFIFNKTLTDKFCFSDIKRYLLRVKDNFLSNSPTSYSNIVVNRCAYCGIGLLLLKEEDAANELADFLCQNRLNNEDAWGLRLTDQHPDILSTHSVTMLLNRLHKTFSRPSFINEFLENCTADGIPFNMTYKNYRYIEALTLALYMDKFYYRKTLEETKVKYVNDYYSSRIDAIYEAKEAYFNEHPCNQWRIFGFGLASYVVSDLNNPFYKFVLEQLTEFFDNPHKNIPYVLEICRMYNAINKNNDPFKKDKILSEILFLKKEISNLQNKVTDLNTYNREITIKMPIATAFIALYFLIVGGGIFILCKGIMIKVFTITNFDDLFIAIDLIISILVPIIGFVSKKTRVLLVKIVNKFYTTFDVNSTL